MIEIDWSDAPEGATHFMGGRHCPWYRKDKDGSWFFWTGFIWVSTYVSPDAISEVIQRPSPARSGEGLPPVGTLCEICAEKDNSQLVKHEGKRARIVAHSVKIGGQKIAVYEVVDGAGNSEYHALPAGNFRPIRTPEQIAADEREAFIDEIALLLGWDAKYDGAQRDAGKIFDAGYRKQADK
jgi:hypothetical protein